MRDAAGFSPYGRPDPLPSTPLTELWSHGDVINDCTHTNATANTPGITHSTNGGPELQRGHCPDCDRPVRHTVPGGPWHLEEPDELA